MDKYQFLSSIVDSIVWPVTVIVGLFLFKGKIIEALPYIRKIKIKDFELDLKEAKQELPKEIDSKPAEKLITIEKFKNLYPLAELSPRSAILESWLIIETAASELAVNKANETPGALLAVTPLRMGEYLASKGLITEGEFKFFNRLRELRNKAVHLADMTISLQEAADYIDMSITLTSQLIGRNEP